jgi:hypothetical protein
MGIIVSVVDLIVLLLCIVTIPRVIVKNMSAGSGSTLLAVCVAVFAVIFATVSFSAMVGFLTNILGQLVWLVVLLILATLLLRASKEAAV